MGESLHDLVEAAAAGRTVYVSSLRQRFDSLSPTASFLLIARVAGFDGEDRVYTFTLPKFGPLAADERAMVVEYVLAGLYNIISTVGGRGLALEADGDDGKGAELAAAFQREFGIDLDRLARPGYGRAVNVSERMDEAISPEHVGRGRFRLVVPDALSMPTTSGTDGAARGMERLCDLAVGDMSGLALCGMDIGGTDIKLCLAVDGKVARFIEYDWFPAAFTTIDQIIEPILLLVRLVRLEAARASGSRDASVLEQVLAPAFAGDATKAAIETAVREGEALLPDEFLLDGVGVCFPDVVVRDKIVGGEVYKTRGIRANLGSGFESEFRRLTELDAALRAFVKPDAVVGIVNDGPMAAFTATVELGTVDPSAVVDGVFAHTLGTELGTGWITEEGAIPEIPLELYNCVIDLGSYPERRFEPDDVRSVNNFNTRVAGTLQKYTSQSGVFRLAAKYLPAQDPDLFAELLDRGLVAGSGGFMFVPTEPHDMRKPLLEFLMQIAGVGGHPAVDRIFREIGEFMAVAWIESKWLLDPAVDQRILFGRLVKHRACFDLMVEGAHAIAPALELVVADDEMANTALMRQLRDSERYSVAQFAQAIGSIHYANWRRKASPGIRPEDIAIAVGAGS